MKDEILKLRSEGKSYNQIKALLNCSKATISYYCSEGQKEKVQNRTKNLRLGIPNKKEKIINPKKVCVCGKTKDPKSKICKKCVLNNGTRNRTLSSFIDGQKYLSSKCQEIRAHAKVVMKNSLRIKQCVICKTNEFNSILEIHHIKGILKFDKETLIKEINDELNLVWVCPNHHAMIEKGLIELTQC